MATATVKTFLPDPNEETETTPANTLTEAQVVSGSYQLEIELDGDIWIAAGGGITGGDNLLGEGFETPTTGYEEANWTEVEAGSSVVNPAASHAGTLWRTDKGSQALSIYYDATNLVKAYNTLADNAGTFYLQYYWYFDRNCVTGNNDYCVPVSVVEVDGSTKVLDMQLAYTTGDGLNKVTFGYYNYATTWVDTSPVTVTPGNWYGFRIKYIANQSSAGIDIWIDSGAGFVQYTPTDTSTRNQISRQYHFGMIYVEGTDQTATFQYDIIKIDSAAFETGY